MDFAESNLDALARNVLKEYGIEPEKLTLVQVGAIKTVWKLIGRGRQLCLKRLKQTYDKALFSVNAQIFIKNSAGKVPGIVLNRNNRPITEYNGQLFVVYEWVSGNDLNFDIPADLRQALQGLAAFHAASKNYLPPQEARISTKLGKWPDQYNSMKRRMAEWKEISSQNSKPSHYPAYLAVIDPVLDIADQALERLADSDYQRLTQPGSPCAVLCHQDFGRGNVLVAADGVYVLDLDGVTYDLAARDLRKIIGKNAVNAGQWSVDSIMTILDWYTQINPLGKEELKVLYADLTFPHWFFGLVKNLFQNGKALKPAEIERIAALERSKEETLKTLLKRSE